MKALILSTAPNVTMDDKTQTQALFNICSKQLLLTALSNNAGELEFETKTENAAKK